MSLSSKYRALFAEDNLNDLLFVQRAIERGGLPFILYHVPNGEEAARYLRGEGSYGDRECYPFPDLVISNMKMPRMNGLQLLQWIRQQSEWKRLPVIVLSSAGDPEEVTQFEVLSINAYYIKPVDPKDLETIFKQIIDLLPPLG